MDMKIVMQNKIRAAAIILFGMIPLLAQPVRVDPVPVLTVSGQTPPGAYAPVFAIPGSTIAICTDSLCTTHAVTYSDYTGATPCPNYAPVTLLGTSTCVSTTGPQGQFGFWMAPGLYYYTVVIPNGTLYGPYPLTVSNAPSPNASSLGVYFWAHFRDDDPQTLRFSFSSDDLNWTDIQRQGSFTVGVPDSLRDPSVTYQNGTFYFIASPSAVAGSKVHFFSSTDLIHFSAITLLDVSIFAPGATAVFAPEFWHDPNTGLDYMWMPISTAANPNALNAPFTMYLAQINLSTASIVGTPVVVAINGTTQSRIFDPFPYYANGTHYLFYVDQQPTGDGYTDQVYQPIAFATSSNLTGPYTQQTTPGADYFGWGDLQTEATTLSLPPNGCVRITVDHWILPPIGPGSGGRRYFPEYKDSCPGLGSLFSQASLVPSQSSAPLTPNISNSEQGTKILFQATSPAVAVIQAAYQFAATDSNFNSRTGIGTNTPFYTLEVKSKAAQPGQLLFNEAVSIGVDTGSGQRAQQSGCGTTGGSCALQFPGAAIWTESTNTTSDYGIRQFSNSNTDTQAGGIMFGNGVNQFGRQPVSASAMGNKAIWALNANSKLMNPPNGNWAGIFNPNIGANNLTTAETLGTLTNTTGGCYGMKITTGANPVNVVGLGRWKASGNIGNHTLVIENSAGAIIPAASFDLDDSMQYGVTGHFVYVPTTPYYALAANTVYYVMSSENPGSDMWYDNTTTVTPAAGVATVNGAAFQATCGTAVPTLSGTTGNSYGPLDVLYSTNMDGSMGGYPISWNPNTGENHMPWGITFGSGPGTAYGHDAYGSIDSFGSAGSTKRINFGTGALGSSDATNVTGALDVSRYIGSRGGSNTDLAGTLTLDGTGHASYTFQNSQAATSICTVGENTIAGTGQLDGPYLPLDVAQQLDPRSLQTFALKGVSVAAGATQVLAQVTGSAGALTRIQYACGIGSRTDQNGCGNDGTVTIIADGVTVLSATNGIFYGTYGYDSTSNQGALTPYARLFYRTDHFGIDNYYTNNAYGAERNIYVPFTTSLTVEIVNNSTLSQTIFTGVDWRPGPTPIGLYNPRYTQFHSLYTPLTTTVSSTIGTVFYPLPTQTPGVKGLLDSIFVFIDGTQTVPVWLEGHPKVTVDGTLGPTQNGTEDFFCSHYYFIQPTHSNECGALFVGPDTVSGSLYFTGMYRFFRQMPVPFNSSIQFSMENGHAGEGPGGNVAINYASLVTWYTAGTNDADNYLPIQSYITSGPAALQIYGTPNRAVSYHCIAHEF